MKTKTFDCVEMKRRGAARVQQAIAGMTPQQELEYWRNQTEQLRRRQQEIESGKRPVRPEGTP
ncbi:MAG: hypothetical protein KAY37_11585 [Phycisphaerae bacterium]|nr:hypothetical protein [Phycisphaerae bacterium]